MSKIDENKLGEAIFKLKEALRIVDQDPLISVEVTHRTYQEMHMKSCENPTTGIFNYLSSEHKLMICGVEVLEDYSNYEKLVRGIKCVPSTALPHLFSIIIHRLKRGNVFKGWDALISFVDKNFRGGV